MAKKTVKEFVQEHKKGIMLTTGLVVGTVIGGTVMYVLTKDARGLVDKLKKFDVYISDGTSILNKINSYADKSNIVHWTSPYEPWPIHEAGKITTYLNEDAAEFEFLNSEIVGSLIFLKGKKD